MSGKARLSTFHPSRLAGRSARCAPHEAYAALRRALMVVEMDSAPWTVYAARFGIVLSTNRKNRVLRAPQPLRSPLRYYSERRDEAFESKTVPGSTLSRASSPKWPAQCSVIFGSLPRTNSSAASWTISIAFTANRSFTLGPIASARQPHRSRFMETMY